MKFSPSLSSSIGPGAKGKGRASATSMSWEHIPTPSTNSAPRVSVQQPTPPIPQRSGAPRFGGPTPSPAPPAGESMFPSISRTTPSAPQMPKPPSQGPLLFGGIAAQSGHSTSASTSGGFKPKSTANGTPPILFAGIGNGRQSLFDKTGSANAAPNAFYQPLSSTSASAKRPLLFSSMARPTSTAKPPVSAFASLSGQPAPTISAKSGRKSGAGDTSIEGPNDVDISMLSELSDSDSARGDESSAAAVSRALNESADMDVSAEFSVSVFGNGRKIATDSGARIARTETEAMLPPGAFLPDEEHETKERQQPQSISTGASKSASASAAVSGKGRGKRAGARVSTTSAGRTAPRHPSPPPLPEPEPAHTRTSARRRAPVVKDKDLGRSIPGSLMDDDDDDDSEDAEAPSQARSKHHETDEEEVDEIAPLPNPARRPSRKSRASNVGQAEVSSPRVTRRSSRLSAVGSVGSSSPEPLSPQKPSAASAARRKSARASTAGTVSAKSAAGAAPRTRKRKL